MKSITHPRFKPTAGKVTTATLFKSLTACWSTSLGETSSVTSHPRCASFSATAIPGNRWPPVPPQAIAIDRALGKWLFMKVGEPELRCQSPQGPAGFPRHAPGGRYSGASRHTSALSKDLNRHNSRTEAADLYSAAHW